MTSEEWAEYNNRPGTVPREEQHRQDLLPAPRPTNFVSIPQAQQPVRFAPHQVDLAINHPTTQHVELRTSAVDRAQGFQWMITPISVVVAILAVLVSIAFENEFLSFWTILIFWSSFCLVYVAGWILTAVVTPEFVSLLSTWRQWNVIEKEQDKRWQHYEKQTDSYPVVEGRAKIITPGQGSPAGSIVVPGWVFFVSGLAGVVVAVLYLVGV